MMKLQITAVLCGLFAAGLVHAECPANLSKEDMIHCKSIEKSGVSYQEWQKSQKEMADESTKSPITGEDVTKVAPAAGQEKSGSKADK